MLFASGVQVSVETSESVFIVSVFEFLNSSLKHE